LIPRLKQLGIVVVSNSRDKSDLRATFEDSKIHPLLLAAAGIPISSGSDRPINPYLNIMFASLDPNRLSEAITREQGEGKLHQGYY
jgi:hypothetical protein